MWQHGRISSYSWNIKATKVWSFYVRNEMSKLFHHRVWHIPQYETNILIGLGSVQLHTTNDDQLMEKMLWFCGNQIPLKWKCWITLHATWMELNSNKLNEIQILLNLNEFNWKQMGGKSVQTVLKISLWCWKNKKLWKIWNHTFSFLFTQTRIK